MCAGGILLVGTAVSDVGAHYNQRRLCRFSFGFLEGLLDGRRIIAVFYVQNVPVIGPEAGGNIFGKCDSRTALDGYLVIIVDANQFAQAKMTGQGGRLPGDPLH